ncbi:exo-beta-N-acetylmuramidase NamZ family protein [Sporosarcina sp. SAFN-015]|uniref:exo-beta-N-acetylmuramidase NamZ family protein n=1 Tax=Sporosarcina sp. SAFN-015 TaxID=3387274 RepID=UPI003F812EFF
MTGHFQVKLGVDVFFERDLSDLQGKRIGLLTNQTGANGELVSTIRLFHEHPELQLEILFAPEHGLLTNVKEGEKFNDATHRSTGIPIFSLYGQSKKPTDAMMEKVDIVVFDIQDIGARYYTYIYTMAYMMEACARMGKRMIVLDRPNPIGGEIVEGNFIDPDYTSFVGLYPIPNRHGLTVGELAAYFNEQFHIGCELEVVWMEGWNRRSFQTDNGLPWIPPSPNTTSLDMMLLYPGTCLLEGTNLSEGRGTTQPFEIMGAPFIDGEELQDNVNALRLEGIRARAIAFTPTYQKYNGQLCEGIQLHITDRQTFKPVESVVKILAVVAEMYAGKLEFLEYGKLRHPMIDLLAGNDLMRRGLLEGNIYPYLQQCSRDSEKFMKMRERYLRYR